MTNEALVAAIRSGAGERSALMEQLYKQNEGLMRKIANKAAYGRDTFDDLMQEAYFALENAVEAFDASSGMMFVTYFGKALQWRFSAFQRAHDLPVVLPAHLRDRLNRYRTMRAKLEAQYSAEIKPAQVAAAMGLNARETAELELLLYRLRVVSLNETITEDSSQTIADMIEDDTDIAAAVCDNAERAYHKRMIGEALQRDLDKTEMVIIRRYYSGEQMRRVADDLHLPYDKAQAAHTTALNKLRRDFILRREYMRSCDLYQYSFQRFKNTGLSSVEYIVERKERFHSGA